MSFGFYAGAWIISLVAAFLGGKRCGAAAIAALETERDALLDKLRAKL